MKDWIQQCVGTGLCLATAGLACFMIRGSAAKGFLPFLFIGVVILVALRFGSAAGILGTVGAAMIFAEFLFEPVLSIRIGDSVARGHVLWMVISGIALSEILGVRPKSPTRGGAPRGV